MRRSLAVVLLVSVGLYGCGDTDDDAGGADEPSAVQPETDGASDAALVVVAEDIRFAPDSFEVTAGDVTIEYQNDGAILHTLVIDGVDDFKLQVASKGDVDAGQATLDAGSYTIYCDVPGHRDAGMEGTIEVS
jgi:plastocyanin